MEKKTPELSLAIIACKKAGRILKEGFEKKHYYKVEKKADKIIQKTISSLFPDHQILSENSGLLYKKNNSKNMWIVDPLDGTDNFARKIPYFGVSIALKKNDNVVLGVIFNPLTNMMFYAQKNKGAFLNSKRIYVSKIKSYKEALISTHGPFKNNKNKRVILNQYLSVSNFFSKPIRKFGSPAIDLAFLACGKIDAFWVNKVNIWDVAAGLVILKEAKGKFQLRELKKINNTKVSVIATNRNLFKKIKSLFKI